MRVAGHNYKTLRNRCQKLSIDMSKFSKSETFPLSQILKENSTYGIKELKQRLLKARLLENKCETCGLGPEWQGQFLTLELDHRNGVRNDHRLDNLRILCPNCHTQTPTYGGRNNRRLFFECEECGVSIQLKRKHYKKLCQNCKDNKQLKITKEDLLPFIDNLSAGAIKFNVTTMTIRRWLKKHKLYQTKKGYRPGKVDTKTACEIHRLSNLGLTQCKIGDQLDLSQTTISRIINNEANLKLGGEVIVVLTKNPS